MRGTMPHQNASDPDHSDLSASLPPLSRHQVHVFGERDDAASPAPEGVARSDILAAEVPVALVFNGVSHAVMMATPRDLDAFALGFALSEGILDSAADCRGIEVRVVDAISAGLPEGIAGIEVQLEISVRSFERLKGRRRSMAGRTGCGVCGVESFAGLDLSLQRLPTREWIARVDLPAVLRAFADMPSRQLLNAEAGAIHAAAWATTEGRLVDLMEDVGRHNALDKLLGKLAREGRLSEPGFVLMSSRGSHELVRKCARLGIAAMATISAPTAMGVRMAELAGLRLWGLCRAPRGVLYADGLMLPESGAMPIPSPSALTASAAASMP